MSQFNFARDNTVDIVSGSVHDVYGAYLGGDFTYESPFSDFMAHGLMQTR